MTNDHRPTRSRAPTRGRWRTQDKVTLSLAFLHFHFRNIFGNKLTMGCYFYLQPSSHTGEMAHSRRRYLKFGISSLFLQYLGDELILGCCPPHSQASTRGDGALKTKLLEVWLFYTFTFALFLGTSLSWAVTSTCS